jgi:hypothetical protein
MEKLRRNDLYSLETYVQIRPDFRAQVLEHKKNRHVSLGQHATLYFEDRLTIQYQVQEMLRAERIFEPEGIEDELRAYNPLIPDGKNLKATFMLEYPDPSSRRTALARLKGIEEQVWIAVDGHERVYAIADEDLERENEEKTSAVHFLRFELTEPMAEGMKHNAPLTIGIEHPGYPCQAVTVPAPIRDALARDLD